MLYFQSFIVIKTKYFALSSYYFLRFYKKITLIKVAGIIIFWICHILHSNKVVSFASLSQCYFWCQFENAGMGWPPMASCSYQVSCKSVNYYLYYLCQDLNHTRTFGFSACRPTFWQWMYSPGHGILKSVPALVCFRPWRCSVAVIKVILYLADTGAFRVLKTE